MPEGTEIHSFARWDNSDNNPANPDTTAEIRYGRQTWDEMMNGWLKYYYDQPLDESREVAQRTGSPEARQRQIENYARRAFATLDKDEDGQLTTEEWKAGADTRSWFERRGVELTFPVDVQAFVAAFPSRER